MLSLVKADVLAFMGLTFESGKISHCIITAFSSFLGIYPIDILHTSNISDTQSAFSSVGTD